MVLLGVVGVVVDAEHDRDVGIGRGSRDDHLLGPRVEMLLRALAVGEEAGGLDHELDLELAPRQSSRVALREHLQFRPACLDDAVPNLDVLAQLPKDGVVFQKVGHSLGVPEIVDRNELEVPAPLQMRAKEVPPDPPKPVDPNACLRHENRV